jgi:hypothetical protein
MRAWLDPTLRKNAKDGDPEISADYEQQVGPQQDFAALGCGLMA